MYLVFHKVYNSLHKRAIQKRQYYKDEAVDFLSHLIPNIRKSCLSQFELKMDEDWNMNNQHLTAQVNQIIERSSSIELSESYHL